uniref:Interleukin 20 receptor subunit beta n=1 Tax=Zosterops lateralis melanops TaxID=1220523 RepID=A0A8D2PA98_ZOSLA
MAQEKTPFLVAVRDYWIKSVFFPFLLLVFLGGNALLPAPQSISILSTNMKHFLTWSPVIVQGATVRYSVEFQGEYEREYANGSWIPISECSLTTATLCNITEDISATVAYKLRVRAQLGATSSPWATTKGFFSPYVILMTSTLIPKFRTLSANWTVKVMKGLSSVVHLDTVEAGAEYCVKAQTHVEAINRSSSFSPTQCVRAQGESQPCSCCPALLLPKALLSVSTLFANVKIFQYSCCPDAVLPDTLKESELPTQLILQSSEDTEQCDLTVVVMPSEEAPQLWIQKAL